MFIGKKNKNTTICGLELCFILSSIFFLILFGNKTFMVNYVALIIINQLVVNSEKTARNPFKFSF